jgi:fucose 4-O-acetylase-like acetyltransferase
MNNRNDFLDMAKGIAIILVVIGHTVQRWSADFDEEFWFRVIYSFHMPLFVFLSGAVASFWFNPEKLAPLTLGHSLNSLLLRTKKAFVRLVIPFVCWGVIVALLESRVPSISSLPLTLIGLFRRPDTGLWFLLCIFYCIVLLNIFQALIRFLQFIPLLQKHLIKGEHCFLLILIFWVFIQGRLGNGSGFYATKIYFIYFLLGLGYFKFLMPHIRGWMYATAILIFVYFAPLWHRAKPNNLIQERLFDSLPILNSLFPEITAISGILAILYLVQKLEAADFPKMNYSLGTLGRLSLGIYAMHYYSLGVDPPIVSSLLISAGLSFVILRIPILRTALLGEVK